MGVPLLYRCFSYTVWQGKPDGGLGLGLWFQRLGVEGCCFAPFVLDGAVCVCVYACMCICVSVCVDGWVGGCSVYLRRKPRGSSVSKLEVRWSEVGKVHTRRSCSATYR
ncbi:hypothetical protein BP00DRAFT_259230 [Aspergillus indologenus CBS 114.80]|uniref:Uncharacterized protein n=1 Tax=Aspergillus indologenus CBS 114.80 TaxID=1450541 RepID=A0A2V5I397_9EURO|nr:hypothetical protein BP00DRAFT_259230 [Aspergillus indologenus CBS 114.80]